MQTFKEIPFQNYIELKFNSKNLNEASQQEALIKYKRNAQLLAEIFTFHQKPRETFKNQETITKEELEKMQAEIEEEENNNKARIQEVKETSVKYQELSGQIKEIKNKEELFGFIEKLKENGLYDDSHPYFVQDSPFYLSTTEEEYLEVTNGEFLSEEGLSFHEIN